MFLTIWDPFGPIWTLLGHFKQKWIFCPKWVWRRCFGAKNQFLFEMAQNGPDGPKRVPNGQKHLGWPFWTLLDPFGPLWNVDKPAMFGHFWSKMDHFWRLPAMDLWLNGPKMAWILDLTWVKYIQVEWAPFLSINASLTVKSLKIMPKMALILNMVGFDNHGKNERGEVMTKANCVLLTLLPPQITCSNSSRKVPQKSLFLRRLFHTTITDRRI